MQNASQQSSRGKKISMWSFLPFIKLITPSPQKDAPPQQVPSPVLPNNLITSGSSSSSSTKSSSIYINDFEIIKPISRGAFSRVYLAQKKKTGDYMHQSIEKIGYN